MTGKVILVNITNNEVVLDDLGMSIIGNNSREVYTSPSEFEYNIDTLRNSPSLYTAVDGNYIRINNGTLLLNREDSLDYLNALSKQDAEYYLSRSFEYGGFIELVRDSNLLVSSVKTYSDNTKINLIREITIERDSFGNVTTITDKFYVNESLVKTNTTTINRTDNNISNLEEVIT